MGIWCLGVLLYTACASPVAPTGGPKDERAPRLVLEASTPNLQTNFKERIIKLTFDEWVKLERANQQVVISPPLEYRPEITIRGKSVRIKLDEQEVLKDNTTYSINFGTAVKDITEGNAPENLKFVFSTGNAIDSLSVRGKVIDAKTGEGVKEVLVMLYDNLADTVVQKERPYYFARTNKTGVFTIDYVRADTFKVFALQDANLNYLYDRNTEAIGFPDDFLVLDTAQQTPLEITLFTPDQPLAITETKYRDYGKLRIGFNQIPDSIELEYPSYFKRTSMELDKDSIVLFYDKKTIDSAKWEIVVKTADRIIDTLDFRLPNVLDFTKSDKKLNRKDIGRQNVIDVAPSKNPILGFTTPIWAIDTSKITVLEDSTTVALPFIIKAQSNTRMDYVLESNWKEDKKYTVQILPNALEDIYGLKNDTFDYQFKIKKKKDYGILKIQLDSLEAEQQYLVQLLYGDKKEGAVKIVEGDTLKELVYTQLLPGRYTLEIVEDKDRNRRWSSGDYAQKSQPERYFKTELPEVRKNWEVETKVSWKKE